MKCIWKWGVTQIIRQIPFVDAVYLLNLALNFINQRPWEYGESVFFAFGVPNLKLTVFEVDVSYSEAYDLGYSESGAVHQLNWQHDGMVNMFKNSAYFANRKNRRDAAWFFGPIDVFDVEIGLIENLPIQKKQC